MSGEVSTRTLIDMLNLHFAERGAAPALAFGEQTMTWSELGERSGRIARRLAGEGVKRGERVAILAENSIEYCVLVVAILRAGASVAPLPTLVSADDIAGMAADCGARFVFASSALMSVAAGASARSDARIVEVSGEGEGSLSQFLGGGAEAALPAIGLDDEYNIIYSSGTTGRPKGIIHTHRLRARSSQSLARDFPLGVRTLTTTALYSNWTMGALTYTLWAGGCLEVLPRFTPDALVAACSRSRPHNVFLIPVQIERLLAAKSNEAPPPASLKWCAGSHLGERQKRGMLHWWPGGLVEIYGMTEGAPFTILRAHEHPDKLHTVGRSDPPSDIKIIGEDERELAIGERGEVIGKARSVMRAYNNAPGATQAIVWRDGEGEAYFRSGDIGVLDRDGFLQITGRKKDVIISGGLNLYASDIEAVIAAHPAVAEAAVIAVPSAKWGESPAAVVVLRPGCVLAVDELLRWANQRLGRVQRLSALAFADELPRGGLGKILRNVLRDAYRGLGDAATEDGDGIGKG